MRNRMSRTRPANAVFAMLLAGAAAALLPMGTYASDVSFPTRPVRFIVGNTAGSGADLAARIVARGLTDAWKEAVIVDNRGGVGGLLAAEIVAKAEPDGQTLMLAQEGAIVIAPAIQRNLTFDPQKALAPVVNLADTDYVLIASAKSGIKTLDDLPPLAPHLPDVEELEAELSALAAPVVELVASDPDAGPTHDHVPAGQDDTVRVPTGQDEEVRA